MKNIYLVLTKSPTMISKIIAHVTDDEFTHSSISFSQNLQPMYSFGRYYAYLQLPGGLKEEKLDKGFYKAFKNTKVGVYELKVSDEAYLEMQNYVNGLFADDKHWSFSVKGLAAARFGIKTAYDHKMFCSQFVAECLKHSKEITLTKDCSLYRPYEFSQIEGTKCIYKGKMCDLAKKVTINNH